MMNTQKSAALLARITVNSAVMTGKPTIRNTRLTVEHLLKALAAGLTFDELHDDFPFLETDDLNACLLYAAELVESEKVFSLASAA